MKRAALCGNRTWCFQPPSRGFYPKRGGEVGEGSKEVQLGACPRYGAHRAQPSSTRGPGAMRDQNWGDEGSPGALCAGTSCSAQVFAGSRGGGNKDPVPQFEASWKMKVCPQAAGD